MNKPARLYPKPEPMTINPKLMIIGSAVSGALFFILGWTVQNIGVFV